MKHKCWTYLVSFIRNSETPRMAETYTLNWYTFSDHLQLMFKNLYDEREYSDVTLVCDDQTQFKAHKIVLSACSPVFKKIIDNNPSQHPLIYLMGVQSYEMESILQFMYLGEGRFYYERMEEFLKCAKDLEVKEISKGVEIQNVDEDKKTDVDAEPKQTSDQFIKVADLAVKKIQNLEEDNRKEAVMDDEENATDDDNEPKQPSDLNDLEVKKISGGVDIHNVEENIKNKDYVMDDEEKVTGGYDEPKQTSNQSIMDLEVKEISKGVDKEVRFKAVYFKNTFLIQSVQEDIEKEAVMDDEVKDFYEDNELKQTSKNKIRMRQPLNQISSDAKSTECPECGKVFSKQSNMLKHYRSEHEGIMYPCNQCDYKAKKQSHLKRHIQSKHEGIKYPCNQCDSQFADRRGLQRHLTKHEGIRFPCNQCDYKATEKGSLQKHIAGKHSDNTLQCELCGYQTKWNTHYNAHKKTHKTI